MSLMRKAVLNKPFISVCKAERLLRYRPSVILVIFEVWTVEKFENKFTPEKGNKSLGFHHYLDICRDSRVT